MTYPSHITQPICGSWRTSDVGQRLHQDRTYKHGILINQNLNFMLTRKDNQVVESIGDHAQDKERKIKDM